MSPGLAALLVLAAGAQDAPRFEREVAVQGAGRVSVLLDREVYAEARLDLADVRVLDDAGRLVPFFLDRAAEAPAAPLRPQLLNRAFVAGESASVVLDFGEKRRKSALAVTTSGDNFRRRAVVEGSDDGRSYATLVDDAWLFAIPGQPPARYERIELPEGDQRFLRLNVHRAPEDPRRIEIVDVAAFGPVERRDAGALLKLPVRRFERPEERETLLVLDLPGPRHPFREIVLEVGTPSFVRSVAVEAQHIPHASGRREPAAPGLDWTPLGDGVVYRYESGGRRHECLRLGVAGRERRIRLRIRNRDDAPLEVVGASVVVPRERVLFEAAPGRRYRLAYGADRATPPGFDLERTVGDPGAWAASAQVGILGPPARTQDVSPETLPPWTERHPALLWTGLVLVTLALGGLTWRALRGA